MRALVAGSSGFIGKALVGEIRARGGTIHPIVRRAPGKNEVGIDLRNRELDLSMLPDELEGIDAVFQLSGEPLTPTRWSLAKREQIRSSRIATTDVIARHIAARDNPPPVLVSSSAIGYYGNRGDELLDENSTAGEGFLSELCRAWERAAAPAVDRGIRVVHARTGIVLDANGGMLKALVPIFRLGLGAKFGSGRQWMSWISLQDQVSALLFLAENASVDGAFNLTAPQPVRNFEFTKKLGAALGRPAILTVPTPIIHLIAGRRAGDELLLASQRVHPRRLEAAGFDYLDSTLESALGVALHANANSTRP